MRFILNATVRMIMLPGWLAALCLGMYQPTGAKSDVRGETKLPSTMVLMSSPDSEGDVVLTAWDRSEQIHTTLLAASTISGKCVHCNLAIAFTADHASASCGVCPCGASFAACLTGKGTKKTTWQELLNALPPGTGLRIEFYNSDKPDAGVKLIVVNSRTVLLPLSKPPEITDAALLELIRPVGAITLERAESGRLVRLTVKDDWTSDKARRLIKILAEHGIIVNFSAATAKP